MERIEKLWRTKEIIPLNEWIQLRGTPYALQYFPDDFDRSHTFLTESELKESDEQTRKRYSDYLGLMECRRNANYGRAKCFHCLLSPERDEENSQIQSLMLKIYLNWLISPSQ
jgi:hypothetical protein